MQKIRKIVSAVSEKTALPTNQPTNQPIITNNTDFIGPGDAGPKKFFEERPAVQVNNLGTLKCLRLMLLK